MNQWIAVLAGVAFVAGCAVQRLPPRPLPVRCALAPDPGSGSVGLEAFYFDRERGACRTFVYGGSGGVAPFDTREACEAACLPQR